MRNATDFWGEMANCGAASPSGSGTETCNGDGDGVIEPPAAASQTGERFTAWQHLANAGLIKGNYSGVAGTGGISDSDVGDNVPASRISNAGWAIIGIFTASSNSYYTDNVYRNFFIIGSETTNEGPINPTFSPEEAWNIDTKLDDGIPQQGKIWAVGWDTCTDAANSAVTDANYLLTDTSNQCALVLLNAF
jgi:hypothetical protein